MAEHYLKVNIGPKSPLIIQGYHFLNNETNDTKILRYSQELSSVDLGLTF